MSDDIESFVHVLYYLVLRFHETLETSTLVSFIHVLLQAEEIVENEKGETAHVGGGGKLKCMLQGKPPTIPIGNQTLEELLIKVANLCGQHYAAINVAALRSMYSVQAVKPPGARVTKPLKRKPKKLRAPSSVSIVQTLSPRRTLDTHDPLFEVLDQFTEDVWPEEHQTKSEDLFLKERMIPPSDNGFTVQSRELQLLRALKRRKVDDESRLGSVPEAAVPAG